MATKTMPRKDDNRPNVLELSAGELVALLVDEAGESINGLMGITGIDRATLSRYRSGQRQAVETHWRTLAQYALRKKVVKID